ncbi:SRPBCC family protein [Spongiibacter sp. KMU-166]|uniref:SRPBCC family protein n=1 Tax=Spongiibacter thalassae TaxID=2721624 RepID=A0ABX1GGA8_9GAMM|nr:SRPBCC family protein [Spongiibacter thalassae]NKI17956.1 SRPBCC family protein [Spongiibacter thalassae]
MMIEVHVTRQWNIPASQVWALVADFGDISWADGIDRVEVVGEGVGMARHIYMGDMPPIEEVLTSQNPEEMTFSYDIPRGIPMPLADYSANAKITALSPTRCQVDWYGRARPEGMTDDDATAMLQGTYDMLLGWIARRLGVTD